MKTNNMKYGFTPKSRTKRNVFRYSSKKSLFQFFHFLSTSIQHANTRAISLATKTTFLATICRTHTHCTYRQAKLRILCAFYTHKL